MLVKLGFGKYWKHFKDAGFENPDHWDTIEVDDLIEMGMKRGHARIFIKKVEQMKMNKFEEFKNGENNNIKPKQKKECSLLFVGETGVGKSTLLKSFEDFINDVKV